MKTITKNFIPDVLLNPINRNLIIIFIGALIASIFLVTTAVMLIN